jgi:hypothetical protein
VFNEAPTVHKNGPYRVVFSVNMESISPRKYRGYYQSAKLQYKSNVDGQLAIFSRTPSAKMHFLWSNLSQQVWSQQTNGTILVNVNGLSELTNYFVRAIIIEKGGLSKITDQVPHISFATTACKKEGFLLKHI